MSTKLIDGKSVPATRSELDLFSVPATQVAVEHSQWNEFQLKNSMANTEDASYEFQISANPQMLQLSKNYLLIEARITDASGNPIKAKSRNATDTADVDNPYTGPIQALGKTFIKQVKVYLNGTECFDSGPHYAYRAFLETELSFGWESKSTLLTASGYEGDTLVGNTVDDVRNTGFLARCAPYRDGNYVQLMSPLHCDLFQQDRYLINNIDVRIVIYRNTNKFCLLNFTTPDEEYKLEIRSMRLFMKSVDVLKSISLGLEKTLKMYSVKYPVRRVDVRTQFVSEGRRSTPENSLYNGIIPRRMIIGCVSAAAYHGNLGKSPFQFGNFDLTDIYINAGGVIIPSKRFALDFKNNMFTRAYVQLFEGLGIAGEDTGNMITLSKFKNSHCLHCFDLSATEDDTGNNWNVARTGSTSIQLDFGTPIPDGGIFVIVLSEFDSLLTVDAHRNVFADYKQ